MARKSHSARPSLSVKAGRSAGVKSARSTSARMGKEMTTEPVKAVKRVIKKAANSLREMVQGETPARRRTAARKTPAAARSRTASHSRSAARSRKAA